MKTAFSCDTEISPCVFAAVKIQLLDRATVRLETLEMRKHLLKDKSGVGIIVDYSRDYTVVNGV